MNRDEADIGLLAQVHLGENPAGMITEAGVARGHSPGRGTPEEAVKVAGHRVHPEFRTRGHCPSARADDDCRSLDTQGTDLAEPPTSPAGTGDQEMVPAAQEALAW